MDGFQKGFKLKHYAYVLLICIALVSLSIFVELININKKEKNVSGKKTVTNKRNFSKIYEDYRLSQKCTPQFHLVWRHYLITAYTTNSENFLLKMHLASHKNELPNNLTENEKQKRSDEVKKMLLQFSVEISGVNVKQEIHLQLTSKAVHPRSQCFTHLAEHTLFFKCILPQSIQEIIKNEDKHEDVNIDLCKYKYLYNGDEYQKRECIFSKKIPLQNCLKERHDIQINNETPHHQVKKSIGICRMIGKEVALQFLFENLEYHLMMGISHIYLYYYSIVNPKEDNSLLLKYFEFLEPYLNEGKVTLFDLTRDNNIWKRPEVYFNMYNILVKNDCIHRYVNEYEYIALIDDDEFITPMISHEQYQSLKSNKIPIIPNILKKQKKGRNGFTLFSYIRGDTISLKKTIIKNGIREEVDTILANEIFYQKHERMISMKKQYRKVIAIPERVNTFATHALTSGYGCKSKTMCRREGTINLDDKTVMRLTHLRGIKNFDKLVLKQNRTSNSQGENNHYSILQLLKSIFRYFFPEEGKKDTFAIDKFLPDLEIRVKERIREIQIKNKKKYFWKWL